MKLEYRRHFAEEERAPVEFKLVSVVIDELNAVEGVESGKKLLKMENGVSESLVKCSRPTFDRSI